MPRFHYKAVSPTGQVSEGEMLASQEREVAARIQALGQIPIRIENADGFRLQALLTRDFSAKPAASSKGRAPFIRQLGILLRAGLPLDRALEILREVAAKPAEAEVPGRLLDKVRGGSSLADAMAEEAFFPPFCVSMVRAGEASGALDAVLERLADFLEKSANAKAKIKSALTYPAVVLVACLGSIVVLFAFVVPRFRPFFEDTHAALPLVTRAMLATGDLVQHSWWLLLLLLLAFGMLLVHAARAPRARRHRDRLLLKLPLIGELLRKVEVAHFSRVLGTLLKNGVPLTNGLKIACETIRNRVLAEAIAGIDASVKEGKGLTAPLHEAGVFPPLALCLVRIGEEAARLDDMLLEVASIYDFEATHSVERMLSLLGPALTMGLGLLVALVIGSIMMAILSVYQLAI